MPYKDPEKRRACALRWYYNHHEDQKAKSKIRANIRYAKDPEKGRQIARKYRDKHPERVAESRNRFNDKKCILKILLLLQWCGEHPEEAHKLAEWCRLNSQERRLITNRNSTRRRKSKVKVWGVQHRLKRKALRASMDPQMLAPIMAAARNYQRVYQSARRALVRSLPATFTAEDERFMHQYWGFSCAACGNQEGFQWTLALDHWIAITAPDCPGTVATNIVPLCHGSGGCNNSKHNRDAQEWLIERFGARKARTIAKHIAAYFAIVKARQEVTSEAAD
jgi:hypothetical protein